MEIEGDRPPRPDTELAPWEAQGELLAATYAELRHMAREQMHGERVGATLQATALVHEAWLRISERGLDPAGRRAEFFHAAAKAMRRILVDEARKRRRLKRGDAFRRVPLLSLEALGTAAPGESGGADALLDLDVALDKLERIDPRLHRVVRLRIFAGLNLDETAEILERSERSVRRDWRTARLWLYRELRGGEAEGVLFGTA